MKTVRKQVVEFKMSPTLRMAYENSVKDSVTHIAFETAFDNMESSMSDLAWKFIEEFQIGCLEHGMTIGHDDLAVVTEGGVVYHQPQTPIFVVEIDVDGNRTVTKHE